MRRWNGWGEESVIYPLPHSAKEYLETQIGIGLPVEDASLYGTYLFRRTEDPNETLYRWQPLATCSIRKVRSTPAN